MKTVDIAFEILEIVQNKNKIGLSELTDEIGLAKSTVHRHLGTLESQGVLVKQGDTYEIGLRLLDFGIDARNSQHGFELSGKKTQELANKTGELCVFMVEQQGRGYILCREEGTNGVQTGTQVGKPVYLHATAGGKSILSQYEDSEVECILDAWDLPPRTPNTITKRSKLFEQLERIRDRGYSLSHEEHIKGLRTIAAPILENERLIGSLAISGPANRMTDEYLETEVADLLLGTVNELELNLEFA